MGAHYRSDTEGGMLGFVMALWTVFRLCQWVEPNDGVDGKLHHVLFYRNRNGLEEKPGNMKSVDKGLNGNA